MSVDRIRTILNLASGSIQPKLPEILEDKLDVRFTVYVDKSYPTTLDYFEVHSLMNESSISDGKIYVGDDVWTFLEKFIDQFDIIACHRFLEHVPVDKLLTFIYLMRSKVKTGGYCDIIVPNWNDLRQIDIDSEDELMTKNYLTVVYELCNFPGDPHASVFTPKKLKKFFELEGGWKHLETKTNYNFAGRNIYFRSIFQAI